VEENKAPLLDWKRLLITIAIILVTAVVVGGGVWLFSNQYEKSLLSTNTNELKILQKQLDDLRKNQIQTAAGNSSAVGANTDIRKQDLTKLTGDDTAKGKFLDTQYADFTGDNIEDAVVTFQTEGTAGYKNVYIYTLKSGTPTLLYSKKELEHGQVSLLNDNTGVTLKYVNESDSINLGKSNSEFVVSRQIVVSWNGTKFIETATKL